MNSELPKVTIITISYNAVNEIEKTIISVLDQTYTEKEYIIIDGKSNDGTTEIISEYRDKIDIIVSEKDSGIYDAMNKGIGLASGDWIIFMNAGDCFADNNVIERIFRSGKDITESIIFGDVINQYNWGQVKSFGRYFKGKEVMLPFSHQSVFVRSDVLKKERFDTSFKTAGDHELFYRLYLKGYRFRHLNEFIAIYDVYGRSGKSMNCFREVSRINSVTGTEYFIKYFRTLLRHLVLAVTPDKLISAYQKKKYRKLNRTYESTN